MDSRTTLSSLAALPRHTGTVLLSGFALLLVASAGPAWAGNATPHVYGQTIGNWGHAWWQWVSNFSAADNVLGQVGDVDCSAGQSGKVWYLAGTFGGPDPTVRTCTIKDGKALFFPLFNGIFWTPEDCIDETSCRAGVGVLIDTITSWTCTVDGVPCVWFAQVVRAQSDARPFKIPAESTFTAFGYAPGRREISVADGYWVMLDPLPRGEHTIHFTATSSFGGGFELDVTYHLTVGPKGSNHGDHGDHGHH